MAKNKDADDDEPKKRASDMDEDGDGEHGGKSKKKLIIIIVAALLLLIGVGAGLYFSGLLPFGKKDDKASEESAAEGEAGAPEGEHGSAEGGEHGKGEKGAAIPGQPIYYNLPEFLVNLNTGGKQVSFLKMQVTLELPDEATKAKIEANLPRVVDNFTTYLRELRASDLSGSAGIYRLHDELMLRINAIIAPSKVKDVLFKNILVQ